MQMTDLLRRLLIALLTLGMAGGGVVAGGDLEAAIDWIYYKDASGREISYDFNSATIEGDRTVTLPGGAVTVPASEAGTTFTWERGDGVSDIWLDNNRYYLSVPQALPSVRNIPVADITVDGSIADWSGVAVYADDVVGDVDAAWPVGCDVDNVKLAYSSDGSTLYILLSLAGNASQDIWYLLFLDRDVNGNPYEPGDSQMNIHYDTGWGNWTAWTMTKDDSDVWQHVAAGSVVSVSGAYIEVSVVSSAFGLPANVDIGGETSRAADPLVDYDRFSSHFRYTEGSTYLNVDSTAAPTPTEWQCAARISNFSNPSFGDSVPYLNFAGALLAGSSDWDDLVPGMEALWITGDFEGAELDGTLVIRAFVESYDDVNDAEYDWEWGPGGGGGVAIDGLDPGATVVDLKVEVTGSGQTASFYYRIDSDDADDWQLAISHTLPVGTGTIYGFPVNGVCVGLGCGFIRSAPVYRFWSDTNSRHFYTIDRAEKNKLITTYSHVWTYEQIAYYTLAEASSPGATPVYRFWSDTLGAHFYTIDEAERDKLVNIYNYTWTYEGPAFYAWPEGQQPDAAAPVYRFWSETLGCHFYTMNQAERDKLITTYSHVWTYEGVAWYAYEQLQND